MVCDTLKNPCPLNTSPCVRSKRPCVYRHHAQTCSKMCAWCWHTRRRIERTHRDVWSGHTGRGEGEGGVVVSLVFSSVKQVFLDILEHINQMLGSSLIANFSAYQNLPTYGLSRASEVHQRNPWILQKLRMERAQPLNAPLLPIAMYSSYETRTLFRLFVQRPSRHFFLALSSSFYLSMTTQ